MALTKFCVAQFSAPREKMSKADHVNFRQKFAACKEYDDMTELVGSWTGAEEMKAIVAAIEARPERKNRLREVSTPATDDTSDVEDVEEDPEVTPPGTQNPEPPGSGAPLLPGSIHRLIPLTLRHDAVTPTPGGGISMSDM